MPHNPNPAHIALQTTLEANSLHDFKAGAIGQCYYGAMNLHTGVMYLVPSVDPDNGHMATDTSRFQNAPVAATHGLPQEGSVFGAGHLNAMTNLNHFFNIIQIKSECAAFAIRKTGGGAFTFVRNSTINAMGSFIGWDQRALPDDWATFIEDNLAAHVADVGTSCIIS
jgi:hypothetical protein